MTSGPLTKPEFRLLLAAIILIFSACEQSTDPDPVGFVGEDFGSVGAKRGT